MEKDQSMNQGTSTSPFINEQSKKLEVALELNRTLEIDANSTLEETMRALGNGLARLVSSGKIDPEEAISALGACRLYAEKTRVEVERNCATVIATMFELDELTQIRDFFASPAGKKYGSMTEKMSKEITLIQHKWAHEIEKPVKELVRSKGSLLHPIDSLLESLLELTNEKISKSNDKPKI